jgi:glucose/arabinose dehydrogenase
MRAKFTILMSCAAMLAVAACGGGGETGTTSGTGSTSSTTSTSTSSGGVAVAFRARRVATSFNQPVFLTAIPDNSGRVLVVEKGGLIRILTPSTGAIAAPAFLDVSASIATDGERGLLGLALAPDFATSGVFYIYVTNTNGDNEVRRFRTLAGNRNQADATTGDVILRVPHPNFGNHNGGWIGFGPDGFLYVASGDGGGSGDPAGNAQNTSALLGKILRLDVASDAFASDPLRDYSVPASNPFASAGGAPEVYAYGLRNPWRASFDNNGNLYVADVGQNSVEEINLIPAGSGALNFGWNRREGTIAYNGAANSAAFTAPVAEYQHGSGARQGNSIVGGYVYRGPNEGLRGQYIFADYVSRNIWSIPVASLTQGQTFASSLFVERNIDFRPDVGSYSSITSFGTDQTGNLYILDGDGEIFIIENS